MADLDYWCGDIHEGRETARITRELFAAAGQRGMTAGFVCPTCHKDAVWRWGPGSKTFVCKDDGTIVDPRSGEELI